MRQGPGWKQLLGMEDPAAFGQYALPIVEILGHERVLIEHYRGVVEYGCQEIGVRVKFGILLVKGTDLCLAHMTREQIVIHGCIDCVSLIRNKEGKCRG